MAAAGTVLGHPQCGKVAGGGKNFFQQLLCRHAAGHLPQSRELVVKIVHLFGEGVLCRALPRQQQRTVQAHAGGLSGISGVLFLLQRGGRIVEIEDNASGRRLKQFLARFHDPENMVVAAEFGIGLNTHSRCAGNCYIEDESTYGTFHIGFGRNIALGGVQDASGHYDLVTHAPCIYVDNRMIMDHGQLTVLEPSIYI